jgi:hypothetical protein
VSLTVVGTAQINGRAYQFRGPPVVVTINAPAAEAAPEPAAKSEAAAGTK